MSPKAHNINVRRFGLATHLRRLREKARLSKTDLALKAELSYRTILDLEGNKRSHIQEGTLMRLAQALNVDVSELVGDQGNLDPDQMTSATVDEGASESSSSKSNWKKYLLLAIAVLIPISVFLAWKYAVTYSDLSRTDHVIEIRDGLLKTLIWRYETTSDIEVCLSSPWSDDVLIVGLKSDLRDQDPLLALDRRSGAVLWTMKPDIAALVSAFGRDDVMSGKMFAHRFTQTLDIDGDGRRELLAYFRHSMWYPACICIVDTMGRIESQYAFLGHLHDLEVCDLDGDGKDEIIAGGNNNSTAYEGAMITVLDEHHITGASVDPLANPECAVADSSLIRVVFPQYPPHIMTLINDVRLAVRAINTFRDSNGDMAFNIEIGPEHEDRIVVMLDKDLRLMGSDIKDTFRVTINSSWPDSLRGYAGPDNMAWRDNWLAQRVRFEEGRRVRTRSGSAP